MTKKWYLIISVIIVLIAALLRFYNFSARAPFDWDQNRDYLAVAKIASGNLTLVGPVAKGDGGFLLGPLYYYLVAPSYIATSGNPYSLPFTSIILDLSAVVAILVLLLKYLGGPTTLLAAFLWSTAFVSVETSIVSWNVAMVPLYTILFIAYLFKNNSFEFKNSLIFGLLVGLAWHVHAALIPLTLIIASIYLCFNRPGWKNLIFIFIGYLVAILPLIIFDLRHMGLQRDLILQFFTAHNLVKPPWQQVIESVISRFGKNIYAFVLGTSDPHLWWGIGGAVLSIFALTKKEFIISILSLSVFANLVLAILLREVGFPEYYLQFASISLLMLTLALLRNYLNKYLILPIIIGVIFVIFQYPAYTARSKEFAFSLSHKIQLVQKIVSYNLPIQIHNNLPYGRDSGIDTLIRFYGGQITSESNFDILLTESHDPTLFINGEIAQDLGYYGGFRLGIRGVQ